MGSRQGGTPERPALFFDGPGDFRAWLERHHDTETELWMGLSKKHVSPRGLQWAQAVEEALCFGWIDSQAQRINEDAVRQRWTPRKPSSTWSNVNIKLVAKLLREGRMTPAGLAAFERRKADRQGIYAYEQAEELALPEGMQRQLSADPRAAAFWDASPPSYRRLCVSWVTTAKQEATRVKRMAQLIEDSAAGRLIPPQRYGAPPGWLRKAAAAAAAAPDTSRS